ncbi:Crp/Fnr family transcriptional regulator [Campylobacter mucosalis]|uniref:Crp/Fnr family transcriptional regulator n=1 Tax=Campylobacter mucosalis TaxID=202 RepID=UPI0014704B77|nr:Crp/Fnr family transcriptional regulator [Campylobacter mucosalis]
MLKNIPFFKCLNSDEIARLEQISVVKKYKKGEFLFMEGDEPKWLNYLISGSLKIYKTSTKGKEIFLHQLRPLNFVAELANFENIPYPASAIFTISGEVLKIDYQKFQSDFMTNPVLLMDIIKSLSQKLKITSDVLHQELVLNSEARVAKFIIENEDLFNTIKHTKIASILNITPETFSRILNKFKTQDLIKLDENNRIISKNVDEISSFYIN